MYTRCPACHTVYVVNAALLAAAGGRYRCARCNKVSNALDSLFDECPAAGDRPHRRANVPVLGLPVDLAAAALARQQPSAESATETTPDAADGRSPRRLLLRATWIVAALLILGFSAFRLAEFHGRPLLERIDLEKIGLLPGVDEAPFRDPDSIHLVSRELRTHPSRPGRLRLTVTIVNRADRDQPFPTIEVALLDAAGGTLGTHKFAPSDYLGADRAAGDMKPQAYVPLTLDLDDPGAQAVGFELEFQ